MALVAGGRSTLNPNAPLFIPAAFRQVEDFSPEWWQLITTSTWYREYWLSQHQDEDGFYNNAEDDFNTTTHEIADLLPDEFELIAGDDLPALDAHMEGFIQTYELEQDKPSTLLSDS